MKKITERMLRNRGACADQLGKFAAMFPDGAVVTAENCEAVSSEFDWAWASNYLLNPSARAEGDRICASARIKYHRVRASAWAEYQRMCTSARAEYDLVYASARAEYQRICAPAQAEYDRVRASAWAEYQRIYAPARAEYDLVYASARAEYDRVRARTFATLYLAQ